MNRGPGGRPRRIGCSPATGEPGISSAAPSRRGAVGELEVLPDAEHLARVAAVRFVALASAAVAERGRFAVALSGGSTPTPVYA
ncbi:MAG: 6-phosphogluconolactonase, partial [Chloroflexota bacterium]